MKKIIDFIKRLFGISANKPVEQINVVEPEETQSKSVSRISLLHDHFLLNLSITRKEAKNLYGIVYMNKFIYKLRKKRGMNIVYNENTKIYTYEPKA